MMRWSSAFIAAMIVVGIANAQGLLLGVDKKVAAGGSNIFTLTDYGTSTLTTTNMNIGTADAHRRVVVVLWSNGGGPSSMTINGVTAAIDMAVTGNRMIWSAAVPTGSGVVSVVTNIQPLYYAVFNATGVSATPAWLSNTAGAAGSVTLSTNINDFMLFTDWTSTPGSAMTGATLATPQQLSGGGFIDTAGYALSPGNGNQTISTVNSDGYTYGTLYR
jgi:hypothetical protein